MQTGHIMVIVPSTLMNRISRRGYSAWYLTVFVIGLFLLLSLLVAAYLDQVWSELSIDGRWRGYLVQPLIIVYILLIYPIMQQSENNVVKAFRQLVLSSDEEFEQLILTTSRPSQKGEWTAFGAGVLFGFAIARPWQTVGEFSWLSLYLILTSCIMSGLLGWVIYTSMASTRLMAVLHKQPLQIDIFDTRPFEPIGQHSLKTVMAFIGGCAISFFFLASPQYLLSPSSILINGIIIFTAVLFFFLNMRPTHRVLATAKRNELDEAMKHIALSYQQLKKDSASASEHHLKLTEVQMWMACEQRLLETKTWPYNTRMIRTLFFSVLIPGAAALARVLAELWFV